MIRDALLAIKARIEAAERRAGRPPGSVRLVAVSKTFPAAVVEEALKAGHRLFGESYVQEGMEKARILRAQYPDLSFHFIGHLQRNKVRQAVQSFDLIETVDRESLVAELAKEAARAGKRMPVFLQVNISGEASKSGCPPEGVCALASKIIKAPELELQGLMSIGSSLDDGEQKVRDEFRQMATLRQQVGDTLGVPLPELSMGMSEDFELAIEYGATFVRVGSAIFGERSSGLVSS